MNHSTSSAPCVDNSACARITEHFEPLPHRIQDDPHLTSGERDCYAFLLRYYNKKHGAAFLGQELLATKIGKSVRTVRRYLANLQQAGWIAIHNRYNIRKGKVTSNYYLLPRQYPEIQISSHANTKFVTLNIASKQAAKRDFNGTPMTDCNGAPMTDYPDLDLYPNLKNTQISPIVPSSGDLDNETDKKPVGDTNNFIMVGEKPSFLETGVDFSQHIDPDDDWDNWLIRDPSSDIPAQSQAGAPSSNTPAATLPALSPAEAKTGASIPLSANEVAQQAQRPADAHPHYERARGILRRLNEFNRLDEDGDAYVAIIERRLQEGASVADCTLVLDWLMHRHVFNKPYEKYARTLRRQKKMSVKLLFGQADFPLHLQYARQWRQDYGDEPYIPCHSPFATSYQDKGAPLSPEENALECRKILQAFTRRMKEKSALAHAELAKERSQSRVGGLPKLGSVIRAEAPYDKDERAMSSYTEEETISEEEESEIPF